MDEDTFHLGIKALIRREDGKILLLKVNSKKLTNCKAEYWDIPGGRIQRGSTVEETLKREVLEETGIKKIISIKPMKMVLSNIRIPMGSGDVGLILSIFDCKVGKIDNIKLSDEHMEVDWVSPKAAAKLLEYKYPKDFTSKIESIDG